MKSSRSIPAALLIGLLLLAAAAYAQELAVPELRQRVTDQTGTLSQSDIDDLSGQLAAFEQQSSNQIVVLMIPTLEGESLEDYAIRVADKNKMGKKDRNNGVLVLIVKDDRKVRIEVGYGLEGVLTDALSSQIIRNEMFPGFRQGDYSGGIRAGVTAIMDATKGEYTGDAKDNRGRGKGKLSPIVIIFIILFFGFFLRMFGSRRHYVGSRGTSSRGPWWGGGMGGFGGGGFGGGGGFSGGGGSFGGGGGFSGGGGSFGGGGASGSW